jgi:hypothetical protein
MKQQEQIYKKVPISNNIKNYPKTSKNSKALIKAKIIKSGNKSMDVTSKKTAIFTAIFIKLNLIYHLLNKIIKLILIIPKKNITGLLLMIK